MPAETGRELKSVECVFSWYHLSKGLIIKKPLRLGEIDKPQPSRPLGYLISFTFFHYRIMFTVAPHNGVDELPSPA